MMSISKLKPNKNVKLSDSSSDEEIHHKVYLQSEDQSEGSIKEEDEDNQENNLMEILNSNSSLQDFQKGTKLQECYNNERKLQKEIQCENKNGSRNGKKEDQRNYLQSDDELDESQSTSLEYRLKIIQEIPLQIKNHYKLAKNQIFRCKYCRSYFKVGSKTLKRLKHHLYLKHSSLRCVQDILLPLKHNYEKSIKQKYQKRTDNEQHEVNHKRSFVWKHFFYNSDIKQAKCKYCKVKYNVKDGSTSGMLRHMTIQHNLVIKKQDFLKSSRLGKPRGSYKKNKILKQEKHCQSRISNHLKMRFINFLEEKKHVGVKQQEQKRVSRKQNKEVIFEGLRYDSISDLHTNLQNLIPNILTKTKPNSSYFQLAQQFSRQFQVPIWQVQKILSKVYWTQQTDVKKMLKKLEKMDNIKIIMNYNTQKTNKHSEIDSFILVFEETIQKFEEFGESIMIIERKCIDNLGLLVDQSQQQKSFKSILYLIGQDNRLQPMILGLFVIKDSNQSIQKLLQEYFKYIPIPKLFVIISSSQIYQTIEKTMLNYNAIQLKQDPIDFIHIKSDSFQYEIIGYQIKQTINQTFTTKQFHSLLFFTDQEFLKTIQKQILSFYIFRPKTINRFLLDFMRKYYRLEQKINNAVIIDNCCEEKVKQFKKYNEEEKHKIIINNITPIVEVEELRILFKKLSLPIFQKLFYSYLIARYSTQIKTQNLPNGQQDSNKFQYQIQTITRKNTKTTKIQYNVEKQCWQCHCPYLFLTGLPCSHIISMLLQYRGSIQYYINSRWHIENNVIEDLKMVRIFYRYFYTKNNEEEKIDD